MAWKAHTYRFTHDGHEFTRTTKKVYTHAVLLYVNVELVSPEGPREWRPCVPYVSRVHYCGSAELARKASVIEKGCVSYCKSEIVELVQREQ
jgi:hypothetical protein